MSRIVDMAKRFLTDPIIRDSYLCRLGLYNHMSDERFLKHRFQLHFGYPLDLENPKTFNEKLQWLKVYDRKPEYTTMVDKAAVKDYVAERIGREYIIPTLGVWDRFEDIDFDSLPNQFVLKCTHDSGGLVICRNKAAFDKKAARKKIGKSLKRDYYLSGREWPYKNVKPRILAEPYISDTDEDMIDYKLMCYDGKVKCSFTCSNRRSAIGLCVNFYDEAWEPMPFERHYPKNPVEFSKPTQYEKMVELAEKLSKGISFVRVDFYQVGEQVYFGELTFFPGSGMEEFTPEEWDYTLGSWLQLPEKTINA